MPLPAAAGLILTEADRKRLRVMSRHRSTPRGIVLRINIVLGAAEGMANRLLARKLGTSVPTVLLWRKRYESNGLSGLLEDRPRSGRPKLISEEQETAIVDATMKTLPKDATQGACEHWQRRRTSVPQPCNGSGKSTNCSHTG